VVKQDHGWPTPSNRRGSAFPVVWWWPMLALLAGKE